MPLKRSTLQRKYQNYANGLLFFWRKYHSYNFQKWVTACSSLMRQHVIINCLFSTRHMTEGPQNCRQPLLQQSHQSDAFFPPPFSCHLLHILSLLMILFLLSFRYHTDSLISGSSVWHYILSVSCLTAGCLGEIFTKGCNLNSVTKAVFPSKSS